MERIPDNEMTNSLQERIQSIDYLRGAIMVLMAIDHVRVYAGVPAGGPEPAIFFTRWVTHFCAPGFVFFTGVSAFLYGKKVNNKKDLSFFLFTRGLLLVFLELTLIRFSWTFNFNYAQFTLAGVIWMLGWCMIIMAVLSRLKPMAVGIIGILIIFGQQVFSKVPGIVPSSFHQVFGWFWEFVYPSGLEGVPGITILYVLVPWIGVMAAGYGFAPILLLEEKRRNKICWLLGITATLLFIIIGSIVSAEKQPDDELPFLLRLLNQRKYPASPLFLLMTLGPIIALIPYAEKANGWMARVLMVFGAVPMFYYLLHISVIHVSALIVNLLVKGAPHSELYNSAPYTWFENTAPWSLGLLYLVFIFDVVLLFIFCVTYSGFKQSRPKTRWLKYL